MTTALKERDVTPQIKGFLESRQWTGFRLQSGLVRGFTGNTFMRLAKKGTPDWVFVRGREALFVEMKRPGKKPSKDQLTWLAWAGVSGIKAIWADSLEMFTDKYGREWIR